MGRSVAADQWRELYSEASITIASLTETNRRLQREVYDLQSKTNELQSTIKDLRKDLRMVGKILENSKAGQDNA